MKIKIPNLLSRPVKSTYWHAFALVKKRDRKTDSMEKSMVYYDAPTRDAALEGLAKSTPPHKFRMIRHHGAQKRVNAMRIPIWHIAFWLPPLTGRYMKKRGFIPK